jgi:two-component system CheB/CheR fusion protein
MRLSVESGHRQARLDGDPAALSPSWLASVITGTRDFGIVLLDDQGCIAEWVGASERLFGHTAEQIRGQHFDTLFVPEDREMGMPTKELDAARSSGRSEDERWHLRRDGGRFWSSGVLERIPAGEDRAPGFCKIVRDRTDLRMRMEALRNGLQAEVNRHDAKASAFAMLLHELRNTVAPVLYAAELLQREARAGGTPGALDVLQRQMLTMKRLLDDWFEAPQEAPRPRIEVQQIDLVDTVAASMEAVRPAAHSHGLQLRVVLPPAKIALEADPTRMQQMLLNLLGNAIKYTPSGGHIDVHVSVEADMAVIRVSDDGCGISPEVLPRVFDLFTREVNDPHAPEGLGVGLAAVKQLAGLHGGTVDARSAGKGLGASFSLRLPLRQSARET